MLEWSESVVRVGADAVTVKEAGAGRPLLVLHEELGPTAWCTWHEELARSRRMIMPVHPGFRGERIGWMRSVRDLSCFYGHFLRDFASGPVDVLGFSFGGWVAAEMAVNNPNQFGRMALVAPFGIKPRHGFIMDMFPMSSFEYLKSSVYAIDRTAEFGTLYGPQSAEQFETWEDARTECARLAWEPYMHDPSLEPMLCGLKGLPSMVVWGASDAILPESAVRAYERAMPDCLLKIFADCGHRPEIEKRDEFVRTLEQFFD